MCQAGFSSDLAGSSDASFSTACQIVVDGARDHVEIEPLGAPRLLLHVECQRLGRRIAQPFLDRQPVALGLGDLPALLVEEQLEVEALGRLAAQDLHDLGGELGRLDEVLAVHLVVDLEREPAAGPVGLPLQLDVAAGDRRLDQRAVLVAVDDGAGVDIGLDHRHLQHAAGLGRDRQEDRIGLLALLAQRRQHDRLHLVVVLQHREQHLVEAARLVPIGRRLELVLEAERIEEGAQAGVVGRAEARMLVAERIGHGGERLAEMLRQHLLVGHVVGHLAQPVHVVGEAEEPGRHVAQPLEGLAHHGGAHDLAEGADMRQARRSVAGLEQDIALGGRLALQACDELAGLLKRPRARSFGEGTIDLRHEARKLGHLPRRRQSSNVTAQSTRPQ